MRVLGEQGGSQSVQGRCGAMGLDVEKGQRRTCVERSIVRACF